MVRSKRCLMRWYLNVRRLSENRFKWRLGEWWLSRWSHYISWLKHYRLRESSLKMNTLWLKWRNVKLGLSLLIATLRVYSTLHLSYLGLLLNFGMSLSLSSSLCRCSLCFPYLRTIWGFLKFHSPHGLIIISIISAEGLKVCLFAQVNADILEHSSEEATIGEYAGHALATLDHVHHHQVPQMDLFPRQNRVNEECLIIRDLQSVSFLW